MVSFFLYILFFIVLLAVLLLGTIARLFFRVTGRNSAYTRYRTPGHDDAGASASPRYTTRKEHKKIFGADDGEYVDFEEIKE